MNENLAQGVNSKVFTMIPDWFHGDQGMRHIATTHNTFFNGTPRLHKTPVYNVAHISTLIWSTISILQGTEDSGKSSTLLKLLPEWISRLQTCRDVP